MSRRRRLQAKWRVFAVEEAESLAARLQALIHLLTCSISAVASSESPCAPTGAALLVAPLPPFAAAAAPPLGFFSRCVSANFTTIGFEQPCNQAIKLLHAKAVASRNEVCNTILSVTTKKQILKVKTEKNDDESLQPIFGGLHLTAPLKVTDCKHITQTMICQ